MQRSSYSPLGEAEPKPSESILYSKVNWHFHGSRVAQFRVDRTRFGVQRVTTPTSYTRRSPRTRHINKLDSTVRVD